MKRHEMIGIKQAVRLEWMQKTCDLLNEGKSEKEIRAELKSYLSDRMGRGVFDNRSETARNFSISMLMKTWVTPEKELLPLRDAGLKLIQKASEDEKSAIHFCMISAAYPFWYNVSKQAGMLLRLQDIITVKQIVQRTKGQYGDRPTVDRNSRFVIRSLYYWELLKESDKAGCYQKGENREILSDDIISWIIEAQLHAVPEGKATLSTLSNDPALFAFKRKDLNGAVIDRNNDRLEVLRNGVSGEIVMVKGLY